MFSGGLLFLLYFPFAIRSNIASPNIITNRRETILAEKEITSASLAPSPKIIAKIKNIPEIIIGYTQTRGPRTREKAIKNKNLSLLLIF